MPDPVGRILGWGDSLALTSAQIKTLQPLAAQYSSQSDSLTTPVAIFLVERGKKLTDGDLDQQYGKLVSVLGPLREEIYARARALLLPDQLAKLQTLPLGARNARPPT